LFKRLNEDLTLIKQRDPAARSKLEIFLLYPGVHALIAHRIAHWFQKRKLYFIARFISQLSRFFTGIEIHPGAQIGKGLFIDHGSGVVIGETTIIGDNCVLYQGVTLGGTGKETGKRHPTLGNNILVGSGAKVIGPCVIGDNCKIAANAVVLSDLPPNCTAVGVPAKIVKKDGIRVVEDQDFVHIPDPVALELCKLQVKIGELEKKLKDYEENKK